VWAVDAKASISDPRIGSVHGSAHAVTFRQGGQAGAIMLGWLGEDGRALSGPFQFTANATMVGVPAIATGHGQALVAYAGRSDAAKPWSIFLGKSEIGQPPGPAAAFEQPPGGPGGDSIAPTLVALSNQRWQLQWSEGPQGQRQVRTQTLDIAGRPIGLTQTVSPMGSNSGQGLLWSNGPRAVSLYVVSAGRSSELWATLLTCPE
jgi:hypothetical protein